MGGGEEVPLGDGGQARAGAEAEGGAVGDVAEHGLLDARTWRIDELCDAASSLPLSSSALPPSGTFWHSREYTLLVDIIIFFVMLLQFICSYLQNQSWNASNNPPPNQNSPAAPWQTWPHGPEQ